MAQPILVPKTGGNGMERDDFRGGGGGGGGGGGCIFKIRRTGQKTRDGSSALWDWEVRKPDAKKKDGRSTRLQKEVRPKKEMDTARCRGRPI